MHNCIYTLRLVSPATMEASARDDLFSSSFAPHFEEILYLAAYISGGACYRVSAAPGADDPAALHPAAYAIVSVSPRDFSEFFSIEATSGIIT